ncbi:hypothetical protein ACQEU8_19060 [Streptomyces sp. CA-250714]|uniref:hypothetical protein n=1 Tax=Streptomyces sp. CA-250714 TaxID=3240060 RepID=UPI003D8AB135
MTTSAFLRASGSTCCHARALAAPGWQKKGAECQELEIASMASDAEGTYDGVAG